MYIARDFPLLLHEWIANELPDQASFAQTARSLAARGAPPLEKWVRLVEDVCRFSPEPAVGLQIGARVRLEHTGPLGHLLVSARNFGELIDTYCLLEKWFYGEPWVERRLGDTYIELSWSPRDLDSRWCEQLHMAALLTVFRMACPDGARLVSADMTASARNELQHYERFFACPVRFGQKALILRFPSDAMRVPVDPTVPALRRSNRVRRRVLAGSHLPQTSFIRHAQEAILRRLPERSASVGNIAADLCLSSRTFQRRLAEDGLSFRILMEGLRQRRADGLLADTSLSVQEVAFLVGYSEHSTFSHAYRQWTGSPPQQRRARQNGANSQVTTKGHGYDTP